MKKLFIALVLGALIVPALPDSAMAQRRDDHWHGDIHHFRDHDFARWRQGHWFHGPHGGRGGWWWIIGDSWYFYPAPIYPYPDPYVPPVVAVAPGPAAYWYYCRNPAGYYPYVPQCFVRWRRVIAGVAAPAPVIAQPSPPPMIVQQPLMVMQQPYPAAAPPPVAPPATMQPMPQANLAPLPPSSMRDLDDRQLNTFAVELAQINPIDAQAAAQLKALGKHVESFRQALFQRNYNAMDILKDTEDLQHRITGERSALMKKIAAPQDSGPAAVSTEGTFVPPAPAPGMPPTPLTSPPPQMAPPN